MQELIDEISINTTQVVVKFGPFLSYNDITNDKFKLYLDIATPSEITDPFEEIDLSEDFDSVSKILTLRWAEDILEVETDYFLLFTELLDAAENVLDDAEVHFSTGDQVNPSESELPPEPPAVEIVDFSIVSDVFTDSISDDDDSNFEIEETYPPTGEYYLEEDFNNGRIIVKFSLRPDLSFLNSNYIKVQRKIVQRAPARWETLEAEFSLDSDEPWLYIDLPSVDHYPEAATPADDTVYYTADYQYIVPNYHYRIIISKYFAT